MSCNWEKFKSSGEAKAVMKHCEKTQRLKVLHSNLQIDKTLTKNNLDFGCFIVGYDGACKCYDDAICKLDSLPNANKRKDRVTLVGLTIPCPDGMDDDTSRQWFTDVYQMIDEQLLDGTVIGGTVHYDEVHEYTDADTGEKRTSRPHLHVYAMPIIDSRLNAKSYTSRRNMVKMNNEIERLTHERYPSFKFLTGTKKKSKKTVEQLKQESAYKEVEQDLKQREQELKVNWNHINKELEERATALDEREVKLRDEERELQQLEITLIAEREDVNRDKAEYKRKLEQLEQYMERLEGMADSLSHDSQMDFLKKIRYSDGSTVYDFYKKQFIEKPKQAVQSTRRKIDISGIDFGTTGDREYY